MFDRGCAACRRCDGHVTVVNPWRGPWVRPADEAALQTARALLSACGRGRALSTQDMPDAWRSLFEAPDAVRKAAVSEIVARIRERVRGTRDAADVEAAYVWHDLLRALLPCSLSWGPRAAPARWSAVEIGGVIGDVAQALDEARIEARSYAAPHLVEVAAHTDMRDPSLRTALTELARALHRNAHDRDIHAGHRALVERIEELLGVASIHGPDAWRRVLAPDDELTAELLALAAKPPSKPSPRFDARRDKLLAQLGRDACRERLLTWLVALASVKPGPDEPPVIGAPTVPMLIGVAHIAAGYDDPRMLAAIADLGIAGYRKVPHFGALAAKLGTACSLLLAERPDGLGQLARMHQRTRHPPSKAKLAKLLGEVAARLGMGAAELTEIVVDDCGLDREGRLWQPIADGGCELRVDADEVVTRWHSGGRITKSAPAALREADPELVKELRARAKAIRDTLAVERSRLENLLREDREWAYTSWLVRYVEHGLVGTLARRLVWRLAGDHGERTVLWSGDGLTGLDGTPEPEPPDGARIRLWHPAGAPVAEREALHAALAAAGVRQPFAQVERDVFAPLPAEGGETGVRRFAGARVRQHQLAAILAVRGWRYEPRSARFDSSDHPRLALPAWGLSAVLLLPYEEPEGAASERGILLEVTLGELRFLRDGTPLDPHDVPLVAFSEVLRDVALVAHAARAPAA